MYMNRVYDRSLYSQFLLLCVYHVAVQNVARRLGLHVGAVFVGLR